MRRLLFFSLCILLNGSIFAQEYELFGQLNILSDLYYYDDEYNGPESLISGEIELETNHRLYVDGGALYAHHSLVLNEQNEINHTLYEAYINLFPLDWFILSIGKQRLDWGTGYTYSPADQINTGNSLNMDQDIWDQETGFWGGFLTISPVSSFSLTGALNLDSAFKHLDSQFWEDFRYAAYVSVLFGELETFLSYVYEYDETMRPGAGFSFDLLGCIINFEAGLELDNNIYYPQETDDPYYPIEWERPHFLKPFWLFDAGIEKIAFFDDYSLSVIGEYFYTDTGCDEDEADLIFDFWQYLESASQEQIPELEDDMALPQYLGRHYAVVVLGFGHVDIFALDNSVIVNIQDKSFLAVHSLVFTGMDSIDINLNVTWPYGKDETEFGSMQEKMIVQTGATIHF